MSLSLANGTHYAVTTLSPLNQEGPSDISDILPHQEGPSDILDILHG